MGNLLPNLNRINTLMCGFIFVIVFSIAGAETKINLFALKGFFFPAIHASNRKIKLSLHQIAFLIFHIPEKDI